MFALIGGTGFNEFKETTLVETQLIETPYGSVSVQLRNWQGKNILFLPRHGTNHSIAPHNIPYKANIWALKEAEASTIIAFQAVGGVSPELKPGNIVLPKQIIDYTFGRASSFYDDKPFDLTYHTDFTKPIDTYMHKKLLEAFMHCHVDITSDGTYGVTQGPRLETAAEIKRLYRDGCTVVGMTAMPEAILAKEVNLPYVAISLVVNMAPGVTEEEITIDAIKKEYANALQKSLKAVRHIL